MSEYVFKNELIKIFDAAGGVITFYSAGRQVDYIINVVTITTADIFPNDGASPTIAIP